MFIGLLKKKKNDAKDRIDCNFCSSNCSNKCSESSGLKAATAASYECFTLWLKRQRWHRGAVTDTSTKQFKEESSLILFYL